MEVWINHSASESDGLIDDQHTVNGEYIEGSSLKTSHSTSIASLPLLSSESLVVYKRRWFTLFIFSMNTMLNGLIFMSLAPVNNIVVKYYKVDSVSIEWLSTIYMLAYIVFALPASFLMSRWGVRPVITIAAVLNLICTVIHYSLHGHNSFLFLMLGQCFAAVAYSMIIQVPGKISSQWFPEKERSTATSIGVFMNLLGVALGFLQPSLMVKDSSEMSDIGRDLEKFFLAQMGLGGATLLLTFFYKEEPPTPPTLAGSLGERNDFIGDLKSLCRNKYFLVFSQCYGIYFGLFVTFCVLVNPLVVSKFPHGYEDSLGWMGFWCDMASILSCFVIGLLLDRYRKHRATTILLNILSMLIWLAFILVLTNTKCFIVLYVLYVCLGITGIPGFASGIEQAAEMTYPVSEETSSAIILVLGNIYGFIFIFALGVAVQKGYILVAGYTMVGLYFLSSLLAFASKTELRRTNTEKMLSNSRSASTIKNRKAYT